MYSFVYLLFHSIGPLNSFCSSNMLFLLLSLYSKVWYNDTFFVQDLAILNLSCFHMKFTVFFFLKITSFWRQNDQH